MPPPAPLLLTLVAFFFSGTSGPPPALPGPAPAADAEIVREFKKTFRKLEEPALRVEAVLALEGVHEAAVVEVLAPVLADQDSEVVDAAVEVLAGLEGEPAVGTLFGRLERERKEAVRVGLLRAVAAGGQAGGEELLLACLEDKAWRVRYRALQAVEARGQVAAATAVAALASDEEPGVRGAALEALAGLGSESAVDLAIAALEDPIWQVRASAAGVLRERRAKRSIEPLIARMEREEGRLVEDYGLALEGITAKGFGMRTAMWRKWWSGIAERFEIPTDEELALAESRRAENRERYTPAGSTSYHGIETPSRSVLFVVDVSGSMENHVIERERFEEGDYPSFARIDIVKTELQRTIEGLGPEVRLNILAFATEVKAWKKDLVPCNVLNRRSALSWLGRLEAIGGDSKEDLARAGLTRAANLEAGKTNTHAALMAAMGAAGEGARDEGYEVRVDTIFFLSDGLPTVGERIDPGDILEEVRRANDLRKVVIHTLAIGQFQRGFMRDLARLNGGQFVDLGR